MYEALVSFATKIISMFKGQVAEIDDPEIVEDLLAAKYIEEYSPQPSGGGWDACIEFDFTDPEAPTAHFTFGSYSALIEKFDAGRLPMVCFKNGAQLSNALYSLEKDDDTGVLDMRNDAAYMDIFIKADGSVEVVL